ncbi:MAG: glycosyltransferase family 4 protein [Actinomycetota bacterium]
MKVSTLCIGWRPSSFFGWGVFGLNLAVELECRAKGAKPLILGRLQRDDVVVDAVRARLLGQTFARSEEHQRRFGTKPPKGQPMLVALNHSFVDEAVGDNCSGFMFLENTAMAPEALERGRRFRRILAGSSWNTEILQARGFAAVQTVLQGVDSSLFCPGPKRGLFGERFVVFSGGKLEFRKGQDIVVKAFKAFQSRRRDALLAVCWGNPFPKSVASIAEGPHGLGAPRVLVNNTVDIDGWLKDCGLPAGSWANLGFVANALMPGVLREVDLAVFPNRCEGGTNLVAMEAMACGVPVVLSANTGHKDIIRDGACWSLDRQPAPARAPPRVGAEGGGVSDVDELVEAMEAAWQDRDQARRRGLAGAELMRGMDWAGQTDAILKAVGAL